jgi:hypothetical protein
MQAGCSYVTKRASILGSAKGSLGWFRMTDEVVSFDHRYYSPCDHALNIDVTSGAIGLSEQVDVEPSSASARELVGLIKADPPQAANLPAGTDHYGTVESNSL